MTSSSRIFAACLTAALAAPLAACSPLDVFGPRANGEIMSLAQHASADRVFGDGKWSEMRAFHAEQLKDEARRLCGTNDAGEVPSSCDVTYGDTDLPAAGEAEELLTLTVEAADKVPDESVDLVIAQAIDALALEPVTLDPVADQDNADSDSAVTDEDDLEAVRAMLAEENAFSYGLDIALAHADTDLRDRIAALKKASDQRVRALGALISEEHPDWDSPAPGYEFTPGNTEPANPAEAAALVKQLEASVNEKWRRTAANAQSTEWREDAIRLAAHAQRGPA
ncbi:DUF4439 domain-containing protein [Corynebacterium urinipleomorphum]|uniref:DUF4439 domain-containing protein n=1 Tax=Corynebacterium urinipleomorphum TaxID=1852380 RepID=UPI001177FEE3|nr:DUF4439 domain-containing protein [Corynebacterium urinipleomorphum]